MFKIIKLLPQNIHKLLKSYLYKRVFAVRCSSSTSSDCTIEAGVPQGSVLGPILYTLYTANIPTNYHLTISTFADDTAILSRSRCPVKATIQLARHITCVEHWLANWRIRVNEGKCQQVTFTLNKAARPW